MTAIPIAEGLFTWPDSPHLIAGSCQACGTTTFPRQDSCPCCTRTDLREVALATGGTLWTWTIQGFEPKPPYAADGPFAPYGVGYVELAALDEDASAVLVESRLTVADPNELHIGAEMDLVLVALRRDADGNEVVTFAFQPASRGRLMGGTVDVAVVGIGIHPFGRHPEVTGRAQGVYAIRQALADAGIGWADVQCAFGGSAEAGNPDTLVSDLGLTGLPFINVYNGCATGGSVLKMAERAVRSGEHDLVVAVGFDKHPRGAFNADPASNGLGQWYGESGLMLTTQFFALKIQRYLHEYGLSPDLLVKVAAKAFRNGADNPNAWRRKALTEEEIAAAPMLSHPLTQYMFCNPAEGGVALVICRGDQAWRYTDRPVYLRAVSFRTRRFGSFEVFSPWLSPKRTPGPSVEAAAAAFEEAGIGPEHVDVAQLQDTECGAEIMHLAETGFCKDGDQEALIRDGVTEIGGRLPVNTDGGCLANGEPIGASGLRQVYESVLQLRGDAGVRQVAGSPQVAFTHVYGAPGLSACTVLSR